MAARLALIVANDEYDDPGLRQLEAPVYDAAALADVLHDPAVGAFDVEVLHNKTSQEIRTGIEDFFADRTPDDLLMIHFSCHGVKNADGELFLAQKDTRPNRLASTAVAADYVNRQMTSSRAQRIVLFLDCCYGGAFPRGMLVRATGDAQVKDAFEAQKEVGGGRGRVVVTASNAMQYSFEAGELAEDAVRPSVFTSALVDALSSGEADRDGDGWVGMQELFGFVADKVKQRSPNQTPQMWTFGAQGDILVARSRIRRVHAAPLEPELAELMASPLPQARVGLVDLFRERLVGDDLPAALAAHQALSSMVGDDSRKLSEAAEAALEAARLVVTPAEVVLTADKPDAELTLAGPPLARTVAVRCDAPWLRIEYDEPAIRLRATVPDEPSTLTTAITLSGPIVETTIPVRMSRVRRTTVEPPPVVVEPPPPRFTPTPSPEPRTRNTKLVLGAVAAAVVALVVGFVVISGGDDEQKKDAAPAPSATPTPETTPGPADALPAGPPLSFGTLLWVERTDRARIHVGDPAGENRVLETSGAGGALWPSVTPDRRTVIYQTEGAANDTQIRAVASDGSADEVILADASYCDNPGRPSVSADGLIALVCFGPDGRRVDGMHLITVGGRLVRTLEPTNIAGAPRFTPDGEYIVYWRRGEDVSPGRPAQTLYAVRADGTEDPVRLGPEGTVDWSPMVSPDGSLLVFGREVDGDADLWLGSILFGPDGPTLAAPELMESTASEENEEDPVWTEDGTILYTVDGVLQVVEPEPDGSVTRLVDGGADVEMPATLAGAR